MYKSKNRTALRQKVSNKTKGFKTIYYNMVESVGQAFPNLIPKYLKPSLCS